MCRIAVLAFVVAACGAPPPVKPAVPPPDKPAPSEDRPCPDSVAALLAPHYQEHDGTQDITVTVCSWGKFAGPGWIVFHHRPWPAGSQPEVGPEGGIAFIDASGKVAVQMSGGSGYDGILEVKVLDLDGDGDDEVLLTHDKEEKLAPWRSKIVQVISVNGDQLELASGPKLEFARWMTPGLECSGKLATQPDPVKGKQIVIVMAPWKGHDEGGDCLSPGRHVFKLVGGELVEQGAKP